MWVEKNPKAFAYRIYSHFTQQCRQTKYEYHMISIGYSIKLQLKKEMACLLNVCTYVQALKKSLSPLPHPPTSFI